MKMDTAFYSDCGGRKKNEDSVLLEKNGGRLLALAADGLGGMGHGELASQDAVKFLAEALRGELVNEDALCDAIAQANGRICEMQTDGMRMMTTIAALWVDESAAIAATVGDTRIYQFREGRLHFQSIDHSAAQMAVFSGEITAEEIRGFPGRSRLLRALGADGRVAVDSCQLDIQPGDRFLLCSDGFWELITEEEMLRACAGSTAEQWLRAMRQILAGRYTGGSDNNSAAAIVLEGGADTV